MCCLAEGEANGLTFWWPSRLKEKKKWLKHTKTQVLKDLWIKMTKIVVDFPRRELFRIVISEVSQEKEWGEPFPLPDNHKMGLGTLIWYGQVSSDKMRQSQSLVGRSTFSWSVANWHGIFQTRLAKDGTSTFDDLPQESVLRVGGTNGREMGAKRKMVRVGDIHFCTIGFLKVGEA